MKRWVCWLALCGSLFALEAWAQPQSAPDPARVKAQADAGLAQYKAGDYEQALSSFQQAYALEQNPGFLLNIGLCQGKLGRYEEAKQSYRAYLTKTPPDDPVRPKVEK